MARTCAMPCIKGPGCMVWCFSPSTQEGESDVACTVFTNNLAFVIHWTVVPGRLQNTHELDSVIILYVMFRVNMHSVICY